MSDVETLTALTAEITANFVANNRVGADEVARVITLVHGALAGLGAVAVAAAPEFVAATTARRSLANPDKIISMIDGKPYSMLKRHLSQHGLTPDQYRERYNLPSTYPMTAPAYSEQRKSLAVAIGLGRKKVIEPVAPVKAPAKPRAAKAKAVEAAPVEAPVKTRKVRGIVAAKAAAKAHLTGEE